MIGTGDTTGKYPILIVFGSDCATALPMPAKTAAVVTVARKSLRLFIVSAPCGARQCRRLLFQPTPVEANPGREPRRPPPTHLPEPDEPRSKRGGGMFAALQSWRGPV